MTDTPRIQIAPASYHTNDVPLVYASPSLSDAELMEDVKIFTGKVLSAAGDIAEFKARTPRPQMEVYDSEISSQHAQTIQSATSGVIDKHGIRAWVTEGNGIHPERLKTDFVSRVEDIVIVRGKKRTKLFPEKTAGNAIEKKEKPKEMAEAA